MTMIFERGQRVKLSALSNAQQLNITITTTNPLNKIYSVHCLGIDTQDVCQKENWVFSGRITSANQAVTMVYHGYNKKNINLNLKLLAPTIARIIFVVSIDGIGLISQLGSISLYLQEEDKVLASFNLLSTDFNQERAFIAAEIYLKDEWRFMTQGHGFNDGLSALLDYCRVNRQNPSNQHLESCNIPPLVIEAIERLKSKDTQMEIGAITLEQLFPQVIESGYRFWEDHPYHHTKHRRQTKLHVLLSKIMVALDSMLSPTELLNLPTAYHHFIAAWGFLDGFYMCSWSGVVGKSDIRKKSRRLFIEALDYFGMNEEAAAYIAAFNKMPFLPRDAVIQGDTFVYYDILYEEFRLVMPFSLASQYQKIIDFIRKNSQEFSVKY